MPNAVKTKAKENALRNELEARHFFQHAVVRWLVENDGIVCFVLDFALGPLLLPVGGEQHQMGITARAIGAVRAHFDLPVGLEPAGFFGGGGGMAKTLRV